MPTNFDRFRYLNESGKPTNRVRYEAHADKQAASDGTLIFRQSPVKPTNPLPSGEFVSANPPGPVQGVRSILVKRIIVDHDNATSTTADLKDWLLTSSFEIDDEIVLTEIVVTPSASTPGTYQALATLFFGDNYFEQFTQYFSIPE